MNSTELLCVLANIFQIVSTDFITDTATFYVSIVWPSMVGNLPKSWFADKKIKPYYIPLTIHLERAAYKFYDSNMAVMLF